jgi:hypothetical protein
MRITTTKKQPTFETTEKSQVLNYNTLLTRTIALIFAENHWWRERRGGFGFLHGAFLNSGR